MLKLIIRTIVSFLLGLIASFALISAVEVVSNVIHPLPKDFQGTHAEICQHVANYPNGILAAVVVVWSLIAALGPWISTRFGNLYAAIPLALLLIAGVALNISMLPYPLWFKIVILISVPLATYAGIHAANQPSPTTIPTTP